MIRILVFTVVVAARVPVMKAVLRRIGVGATAIAPFLVPNQLAAKAGGTLHLTPDRHAA